VSEQATPLAMVLTELLQNAVEHGYPTDGATAEEVGEIVLSAQRRGSQLEVSIVDNGRGLPEGFEMDSSPSLGLSIVKTLVESELGGHLTLGASPDGGTRADLSIPLD